MELLTQPPVLPGVSYRSVRRWQRRRCEACGTMEPQPSGWQRKREPKLRLQAAMRSGARKEW